MAPLLHRAAIKSTVNATQNAQKRNFKKKIHFLRRGHGHLLSLLVTPLLHIYRPNVGASVLDIAANFASPSVPVFYGHQVDASVSALDRA